MADNKLDVLFLCTGNSARSILAEAIANQRYGSRISAESAGADPKDAPHPMTLQVLEKYGLDAEGLHSKGWERFLQRSFDIVITVCGGAKESCPTFPGAKQVHWPLPDPPAAERPEDMFEAVYDALDEAIGLLANGPDPDPGARATEAARHMSRRFSPRMA